MNKTFALFLFCILLLIGGCKQKPAFRIGVSQCSDDDWRTNMNEEIYRELLLHDDVEVEIRSADDDSRKQIADLNYFADNGFDMIIVAPNEAESLTPAVKELYDRGIPIIIFDRNITGDSYTSRIGVDNLGLGAQAAGYALNLMGNRGKVLEIYGLKGSTPADDRHSGFKKTFTEGGGEIIATAFADWNQEKARTKTDSLLKRHPDINLIFAHNDRMALGAREAVDRLGLTDIKIIGIDAAPNIGIKGVAEGKLDATFLYPTRGELLIQQALKILKGEPYEREVMIPTSSAVDSSNADILLLQNHELEEDTEKIRVLKSQLDDYLAIHSAQTALFYTIIAILVLLFILLFVILRSYWQNRRHREELEHQNKLLEEERDKQKELNLKLEEATQSKLVFFTNVSHDLRTPLTLISEPVAQLASAENLTETQKKLMALAYKNVKILHRLINQILDFRKYENNRMDLNLTEIGFGAAVKEWLESFYPLARRKKMKLIYKEPEGKEEVSLALDVEKIERVFFNLISNALKYSRENDTITVSWHVADGKLILKVADTGQGISHENIRNIFDRFYQVDKVRPRGSGIGLSLAKAFVELHDGTISVESELNKGSTFTVEIPVKHVSTETTRVENSITQEDVVAELGDFEEENITEDNKPELLIIDDNSDIRRLVAELMGDDYSILTAADGYQGIRKAIKYVPDLIICDVMMPGIDGMEVCRRLKEEVSTSHIPVLMLTACSLDEQRVQGFDSGADGYLSKPFNSELLKSQAASLISNRKRIQLALGPQGAQSEKGKEKHAEKIHSDAESDFYSRFLEILKEKMSDAQLSVEDLAAAMGLERTQFYRKIKALTNYSPVELVRNIRLKEARRLLTTTERSISEICYQVGFSTPAYFTKCYREVYGETPSETRNSLLTKS